MDKNKEYKIYSAYNRVIRTIRGEELYSGHYDKVEAAVRKMGQTEALRQEGRKRQETRRQGTVGSREVTGCRRNL